MITKDTNKLILLAISSKKDWLSNIELLKLDKRYNILKTISGKKGLELFKLYTPKIILIDRILSDMYGIAFLKELLSQNNFELPIVIFIDKEASKTQIRAAMETGADDFLFGDSIYSLPSIIKMQLNKRNRISFNPQHKNLMTTTLDESEQIERTKNTTAKYNDYLFLDDKDKPGFYAIKNFVYISSLKDYTQIHTTKNRTITLHKTLTSWEEFLPKNKFLRIHRQTIINLDYVKKVENNNSYRYSIYLDNVRTPFVISQRYSKKLKNGWGIKKIE